MLNFSRTGFRFSLYCFHTLPTIVARICPRSERTDRVKGIPMMAKKMQNRRPGKVTGEMLP